MNNEKRLRIIKEVGFNPDEVGLANNDDKIIMFVDKRTQKEYYIALLGALKKGTEEGWVYKLKEVYQEANWKSAKCIKEGYILSF